MFLSGYYYNKCNVFNNFNIIKWITIHFFSKKINVYSKFIINLNNKKFFFKVLEKIILKKWYV